MMRAMYGGKFLLWAGVLFGSWGASLYAQNGMWRCLNMRIWIGGWFARSRSPLLSAGRSGICMRLHKGTH